MFADYGELGDLRKVRLSLTKFAKVAAQPVKKLVKDPKSVLDIKGQYRMGKAMGRALENVAVAMNPLDRTLKKFDEKGIKAGGVGKLLGRTGEKARKNPVATTAIVYAAVAAIAKFGAKAVVGKAYSAYKYGSAGAALVAASKGSEGTEEITDEVINEEYFGPEQQRIDISQEASALEKVIATVGPAALLLLL